MVTTNLEDDPFWIGKGVNVGPLDDPMFRGKGNGMQALAAYNRTNRFRCGFIGRRSPSTVPWLARLGVPAQELQSPALNEWHGLATASRHGYHIHGCLPICINARQDGSWEPDQPDTILPDDPPVL